MQKLNFYSSLEPYLYLTRLVGLFQFEMRKKKAEIQCKLSIAYCFYTLVLIVTSISAKTYVIIYMEKSSVLSEIWLLIMMTGSTVVILQWIFQIFNGKKLVKLLNDLDNFDNRMKNCGTYICYSVDRQRLCWITIGAFGGPIFAAVVLTIDYWHRNECLIDCNLGHMFQMISGVVHVVQFATFTYIFKTRFHHLNDYLSHSLFLNKFRTCGPSENLETYVQLFDQLTDILTNFNETFTLNLIPTLLNILTYNIFCLWSFIHFIYKDIDKVWVVVLVNGLYVIANMTVMLVICYSGHTVQETATQSEELILDSLTSTKNDRVISELRNLHYRIRHVNKNVENVFFVVNWRLLFMVSL